MRGPHAGPPARIVPLYARAAAPLIPGASQLPFLPGGGGEIPEIELELAGVGTDPRRVAAYAGVCGFALRDDAAADLPAHLAFPLQMALMTEGRFPFGASGWSTSPTGSNAPADARRRDAGDARAADQARGRTARAGSWTWSPRRGRRRARLGGDSTILRRGRAAAGPRRAEPTPRREGAAGAAEWHLPGDIGRRYAAVSGDRNPIHMHALTAKPLGFPAAIAHGMWT